jgi:PIN domain nuclease of toxin-antitoxin system
VKLLLDTHIVLWAATTPDSLTKEARDAIEDGANEVFVSIVSGWELAIKQSLGKLELSEPAARWLPEVLRRTGFDVAEVAMDAALRVRTLPWHHRDPFDRLLIAQALTGGYTVVTHDDAFERYGVFLLKG